MADPNYTAMNYQKIDLPVVTQVGIPNPDNLSAEANYYQYLQTKYIEPRTDSGREIWISPSSGITYNTNDTQWADNTDIFNRGEEGMMNLLHELYAGIDGWILTAYDFNKVAKAIDDIMGGTLTVYNSYNLNGHPDSYFATKISVDNIVSGVTTVGNADKLDGCHATYFCTAEQYNNIINGSTKVGNADKLDGFDSTYFATASALSNTNQNVTNIINGTTTVGKASNATNANYATSAGNANTLGGYSASYFLAAGSAVKTYYGSGTPSSSLGKDGDIYIQV